jgi:hypothetical protein
MIHGIVNVSFSAWCEIKRLVCKHLRTWIDTTVRVCLKGCILEKDKQRKNDTFLIFL